MDIIFEVKRVSVLIVLFSWLVSFSCLSAEENEQPFIIALVDGKEILYEDIKVELDYELIQRTYPQWGEAEIEAATLKEEKKRLVEKIQSIIIDWKIKELGLRVTEEELDALIVISLEKAGVDEVYLKDSIERRHAIANAIEAWQKNPERSDIIYKEKVKPVTEKDRFNPLSKEEWEWYTRRYDTPEKLEEHRARIPSDLTGFKRQISPTYREYLIKEALEQKLIDIIASDIRITEEDVEKYYREKYESMPEEQLPDLAEVQESLKQELLSKKRRDAFSHWLQKKFKSADIEILDERFADIMEEVHMHPW